jgi:hypothetical protein
MVDGEQCASADAYAVPVIWTTRNVSLPLRMLAATTHAGRLPTVVAVDSYLPVTLVANCSGLNVMGVKWTRTSRDRSPAPNHPRSMAPSSWRHGAGGSGERQKIAFGVPSFVGSSPATFHDWIVPSGGAATVGGADLVVVVGVVFVVVVLDVVASDAGDDSGVDPRVQAARTTATTTPMSTARLTPEVSHQLGAVRVGRRARSQS